MNSHLNEKIVSILSLIDQGHRFENLKDSVDILKDQANQDWSKKIISDCEYREINTKLKIIEKISQ